MPSKSSNQFEKHADRIRELAHQGYNTRQILEDLGVEVTTQKKEHLRRYIHSRKLPVAKIGAQEGENHRDWKGGRLLAADGYILLYMPEHPDARKSGYILEHRYVMEQAIGRRLTEIEVVHHINGDTQDNRIENLELFQSNAEHLAETLKGQVPSWTEEGVQRIREGVRLFRLENPNPRNNLGQFSGSDLLKNGTEN
jgi:hypothetical protein